MRAPFLPSVAITFCSTAPVAVAQQMDPALRGVWSLDVARSDCGVADPAAAYFPWYHTLDSAGRRDASNYFRLLAPGLREDMELYRHNAPRSQVVEVHDASHWVFLSNRDETLSAVLAFLATVGS